MGINQKTSFILALIIHIISIITFIIPSAEYPSFRQIPYFMNLHYFGMLILLGVGVLYLISSIKEDKNLISLGFGLGIVAWFFLLFSNINAILYLKNLIEEESSIWSMIFGAQGALPFMAPSIYITRRIDFAIFHIILAVNGLILGIIDFIIILKRSKFTQS